MPLRQQAISYLTNIKNIEDTDFYEFGIYRGKSFHKLNEYITGVNLRPNKIWGFDSFTGLPKEKEGLPIIEGWQEGHFNVVGETGIENTDQIIADILKDKQTDIPCEFIAGFFKKTLTKKLKTTKKLKKASFIDIDVDLYQSTIEIFTYMIENDLLHDQVVVNFDDWGGVEEYTGGESKAFKEIIEKYNLNARELFTTSPMRDHGGILHVQKVFLIEK